MGIKSKFKRFFELDEETYEVETYESSEQPIDEQPTVKNRENVVSLQSVQQNVKVILFGSSRDCRSIKKSPCNRYEFTTSSK